MQRNDSIKILEEFARSEIDNIHASLLLIGLPKNKIPKRIIEQVTGKDNKWIHDTSLDEVAFRLLALSIYQPTLINGEILGYFIKRLIVSETSVGGPYGESNSPDFRTNAAIAQFLLNLKIELPNLMAFVSNEIDKKSQNITISEYWLANWPHKINSTQTFKKPSVKNIQDIVAHICLTEEKKPKAKSIENIVQNEVKNEIIKLNDLHRTTALYSWNLISKADKNNEISLISQYFEESLRVKSVKDSLSFDLGVANFYAWMAYSLYDDFLDEEGEPKFLPIANIMHRKSLLKYFSITARRDKQFILDIYDIVDSANAWEVENCRYEVNKQKIKITSIPNFKQGNILAERAYGHVLGPLLIAKQFDLSKHQNTLLDSAFTHYLIARQLNDDIHDWKVDLERGHITYVVAFLLTELSISSGEYSIPELIRRLEVYFWNSGLNAISEIVLSHINQSVKDLQSTNILEIDGPFFTKILTPMKSLTKKGIFTIEDRKKFLSAYGIDSAY